MNKLNFQFNKRNFVFCLFFFSNNSKNVVFVHVYGSIIDVRDTPHLKFVEESAGTSTAAKNIILLEAKVTNLYAKPSGRKMRPSQHHCEPIVLYYTG